MVQPAKIRTLFRPGWQFVGLIVVSFLQVSLFERNVGRYQAWIYPRWFDQVQYLTEAYQGYDYSQDHGLLAAVKAILTNLTPQGTLHEFWALLIFSLSGPSRSAALTLNMLGFIALQASLFVFIRRMTRDFAMAWMAVGFLMALKCPWFDAPASTVDFRLDWMAVCAYGVALGAGLATSAFRSTRWSLVFGAAVGLVLLTRTLTAVYFVLILIALLAGLLTRRDRWRRSARLLGAAFVALLMAGPVFWHKRHAIYGYYWIGQFAGPERALRESHFDLVGSGRWIVSELCFSAVGPAALVLFLGALGVMWALGAIARFRAESLATERDPLPAAWGMALIFLAVPAGVLCLHPTKTGQPLTILVSPVVWLVVIGCLHFSRRVSRQTVRILGAVVLASGAVIFATFLSRWPPSAQVANDAGKVNALVDYVYYRSEECGLKRPRFAATLISDGLNAGAFKVLGYERHHLWLDLEQTLPTGLFESSPATIMGQLEQSDFVCLLTRAGAGPWPFDRQMAGLISATRPWCETHLKHVTDIEALGFSISLYERRELERPDGGSAVDFAALLAADSAHHADAEAIPPAKPIFPSALHLLWSTDSECLSQLRAAYSPVRYEAAGLPAGVELDARSGKLRGQLHHAGSFHARITATNAAGSAMTDLTLQAVDQAFVTTLNVPLHGSVGVPVEINFEAFDAARTLDFIDITDLAERKLVDRLPAGEDERQSWQGSYRAIFLHPGVHALTFRFVRFDASAKEPYSFVDQAREIEIAP